MRSAIGYDRSGAERKLVRGRDLWHFAESHISDDVHADHMPERVSVHHEKHRNQGYLLQLSSEELRTAIPEAPVCIRVACDGNHHVAWLDCTALLQC